MTTTAAEHTADAQRAIGLAQKNSVALKLTGSQHGRGWRTDLQRQIDQQIAQAAVHATLALAAATAEAER